MITLPASFTQRGYAPLEQAVRPLTAKYRRLMIGIDGLAGSGKSEFAASAPGPSIALINDPGIDNVTNNPTPPAARTKVLVAKVITPPVYSANPKDKMPAAQHNEFIDYWRTWREESYKAIEVPESRTNWFDSDSDSWNIQKLAEYGKVLQVMPNQYVTANTSRKAYYMRLWNSGKIIICTNKLKKEYDTKLGTDGKPEKDGAGADKREWTGEYERQGFPDQDYCFHMQLTAFYRESYYNKILKKDIPGTFGIRINRCKVNRELEGTELIGEDANFLGLVQTVYPHVPINQWGF